MDKMSLIVLEPQMNASLQHFDYIIQSWLNLSPMEDFLMHCIILLFLLVLHSTLYLNHTISLKSIQEIQVDTMSRLQCKQRLHQVLELRSLNSYLPKGTKLMNYMYLKVISPSLKDPTLPNISHNLQVSQMIQS